VAERPVDVEALDRIVVARPTRQLLEALLGGTTAISGR
jgi:hypothetical protein